MKLLQAIHDFEITASGGVAIYFLMCVAYVTIVGLIGIFQYITNWIK